MLIIVSRPLQAGSDSLLLATLSKLIKVGLKANDVAQSSRIVSTDPTLPVGLNPGIWFPRDCLAVLV